MDFEHLFKSEFDRTRELVRQPDWYLQFGKVRQARLLALGAIQATYGGDIAEAVTIAKEQTLSIFQQLLETNQVRLGHPGEEELDNQDEARQPIDTIVIHHSSRPEGISLPQLNALHLLRLYLPVYQSRQNPVLNSQHQHQPIYSGHFDSNGHQVLYGYHWKVDQDGTATRLLDDTAIGWHAGNWEVNKRSVGICIDDDLESKHPTEASLQSVATIIKDHYGAIVIDDQTPVGHNEVSRHPTVCPGNGFVHGWKLELLDQLR